MFRYILQRFRDIFTELFQLAAAVRTCFLLRQNLARFTWQMRRQWLPRTFRRLIHNRHRRRGGGSKSYLLCSARFQFIQPQLQLLDLPLQLL